MIQALESDQELQELTLSAVHATTLTFDATPAVKIVENHLGKVFVKMQMPVNVPVQMVPQQQQPTQLPPTPQPQGADEMEAGSA